MHTKGSQYARSLIEASLDPLVTISTEGKIMDMNNALVSITGKSREELKGTNFFDYFTEPKKAMEVYEAVFAKGFVKNFPLTIKDYKLTDVLFNGSVYKDIEGEVLGAVVVARDITEQKRIEKEMVEAKVFAELATEIAVDAKREAEEATKISSEAVKSKQQFLSNMSHEIRTPMNAIIGFTKVLFKTDLSIKQLEYLQAIKMSGDALIVLINDILDLAKVDTGKMVFEKVPFKLSRSISAMLHLFEPKIHEKNLILIKEVDPNIPDVLLGDAVRLHQIILNLVSNAVKFTATGSITVSVKLLENKSNTVSVLFSIKDTGIGISASKMEHIFENFQQASSGTSRLYGGTGLGLAIVKQLVENQGGLVSVNSAIDIGSEFSFQLEFEKTLLEAEPIIEIAESEIEINQIKVLVVEDIPLNQLLMKTLLDDFGFEKDIAANGKIAIEMMALTVYDIILMDLQMPEMNGFDATQYIRNVLKSEIPIIALTADVTTVDLEKCKLVGMNDYIAKPVDDRLLYSKILSLIKKNQLNLLPQLEITEKAIESIVRYTDLASLLKRTKSNPILMMEMISLFLDQTPLLISTMKNSWQNKEWDLLQSTMHKLIPSFSIMGIGNDYENMAKELKEFAETKKEKVVLPSIIFELERVCNIACTELMEEYQYFEKQIKITIPSIIPIP